MPSRPRISPSELLVAAALAIATAALAVGATTAGASAPSASVPAKYGSLYDAVGANLNGFTNAIAAMPQPRRKGPGRSPIAGAELLAANGNRLSALLAPGNMALVDASLDRLHALGVRGVTLGIKVPMLLRSFSPDAQRYADFYATVADHIRARKMTVAVELGSLFCGTALAACANPFAGSYQAFVGDTAEQARIVIARLHPDFLTLISEPDTEAELTGVGVLDTPAGAARAVGDILARIGRHGRTRIGAGSGTWLPTSFAQAIAGKPIDYLDTHIYPAGPQEGANAVAIAAIARRAHKPLVADEVWLYKIAEPELGSGVNAAEEDSLQDLFSFWEPLDARFLATTADWARKAGALYVSPFWSWQFFTYLTWTPTLDVTPYPELSALFGAYATQAVDDGATTGLGEQWSRDLRG